MSADKGSQKFVITICVPIALMPQKCVGGWASAPDPAGGTYSVPADIGVARGGRGGLAPREWKKNCTTVLGVPKGQILCESLTFSTVIL